MKQPLKHLSIKVTPQTYYHLTQLAAMAGYTNLGKVVDKLVREHQLSMTYEKEGIANARPIPAAAKEKPGKSVPGSSCQSARKKI